MAVAHVKPHLVKWKYVPIWSCTSLGYHEFGNTPEEAYEAWQFARAMLAPALRTEALSLEFRSAYGLSVH